MGSWGRPRILTIEFWNKSSEDVFWSTKSYITAWILSALYIIGMGLILLKFFNDENNFFANLDTAGGRVFWILFIVIVINLPRLYWWYITNKFNEWIEETHLDIAGNETKIKFYRKRFEDNREFAMAMWLAGIGVFTAVFLNGLIDADILQFQNNTIAVEANAIDSAYVVDDSDGGSLIVYEDTSQTKPLTVLKRNDYATLTGAYIPSDKDRTKFQIALFNEEKKQLGWIQANKNKASKKMIFTVNNSFINTLRAVSKETSLQKYPNVASAKYPGRKMKEGETVILTGVMQNNMVQILVPGKVSEFAWIDSTNLKPFSPN